jgi:hypothetical protein
MHKNAPKNKNTNTFGNAESFSLPSFDIDEIFKPITDAFNGAAEQFNLAMQCKMRRFYLVRSVDTDPDHVSGTGVIASGVVFEDGTVVLRWSTQHKSTAVYDSVDELLAIHGHNGKTVIKYIDGESVL